MSVKVSRIFHAGYILESEGITIAFDPLFENPFSRNCFVFPKVKIDTTAIKDLHFDAIFISHYHDDHCSFESLNYLNRDIPIYMYCVHEEMFLLLKELGFRNVRALSLQEKVNVDLFEITPLPALDYDVDSLFHIKVKDLNILNVVDSWIDEETLRILEKVKIWDLILWPFQTMREIETLEPQDAQPSNRKIPSEHLNQLQRLKPKLLIPSSCQFAFEDWSWLNKVYFPISYSLFQKQIELALTETKVLRLDPSHSLLLERQGPKKGEPLPWMQLIGSTLDDYEYFPDFIPPPTNEIAKHFPALSIEQAFFIRNFIHFEMPQIFRERGPSQDNYFKKRRSWQLTISDHDGREEFIYFFIEEDQMMISQSELAFTDWKTEVIAFKLFSALTTGESLSSLYLRVQKNDPSVDPLEDPLIRCLFEGQFGTYQKSQLLRLKR